MDVHGLLAPAVGDPPDLSEQLALGDDLTGPCHEVGQQVELAGAELQRLPVELSGAPTRIKPQSTDGQLGVGGAGRRTAQDCADPRVEGVGREGLDHVVVGAGVQCPDDLLVVVAGSGDDDRGAADGTEHAQQLDAIEVRQAQVEDDHVRLAADR